MKIYYFLNSETYSNYKFFIDKLELLKDGFTVNDLIDKFFYKIGEDNTGRINYSFFLDSLVFIDYIKNKYKLSYDEVLNIIEWVHLDKNFYIYNKDIYVSTDNYGKYKKVNGRDTVYFITSRDSWLNPFFLTLYKISEFNSKIKVIRPNKREGWIYNDDKIKNISNLYDNKKKVVGDVIIPLLLNRSITSISKLLDEVKKKIGNKVVIKKNSSQYGNGVKMLDLSSNYSEEKIDYLKIKFFNYSYESVYNIYFVPYYNIKKEYRVYYLLNNNKVNIYSIKNRINNDNGNVFEKTSYTIGKSVDVKWDYTMPNEFIKDRKKYNFISFVSKKLGYDRGVIEFIETNDGKLIYSEINTLGATLMFPEEQSNLIKYWDDVWRKFI